MVLVTVERRHHRRQCSETMTADSVKARIVLYCVKKKSMVKL